MLCVRHEDGKRGGSPLHFATPEYVAERLREAAETLRQLPMPRGGYPASAGSAWPEPEPDFWEKGNNLIDENWRSLTEEEKIEREKDRVEDAKRRNRTWVVHSRKRVAEMEEVLVWMYWIKDPRNRKIVWAVACGVSYRKVARKDGRSHETARRVWEQACEDIARWASRKERKAAWGDRI